MLTGTLINEQYHVDSLIAEGGCGAVYQAYDTKNKRNVALKHLIHSDSYLRSAFLREAKRLKALHHRTFPEVYEWFEVKGDSFIAMEFIPGNDLGRELSKRRAPFTLEEVVSWTFILLDALNYLHNLDLDYPIIHRDIKPANLKLNETRSSIMLLDLGISKGAAGNISESSARKSLIAYTRSYAPPEQHFKDPSAVVEILMFAERLELFIKRPTDARSDLYSLGATLFTLLTNQLPPSAVTRAKYLWHNQRDPLQPIHEINSQVPPDISEIINRAMSFEPESRFASALEMRNVLRNVLNDITQKRPEQPRRPYVKYGLLGKCDSAVRCLAFSPIYTHLASGSNDGMVRVWNIATGEMTVLGYCNFNKSGLSYVSCVQFAPDGTSVASVSNDQSIHLWHILPKGNDKVRVLTARQHIPRCVAFSPCGKYLVSGSNDGALYLWDIATGDSTRLGDCGGAVRSAAFSYDGASVITGSEDGNLRFWQLENHNMTSLQTPAPDITSLALLPGGRLIAFGSSDYHVRIADIDANSVNDLLLCGGAVRSLDFSPDASLLAIGGEDRLVSVYELNTGAMHPLGHCNDVVSAVVFHSDNRTVASASWDKTIQLWDAKGSK